MEPSTQMEKGTTIAASIARIATALALQLSLGGGYDAKPIVANTNPEMAKIALISPPKKYTEPKGGNPREDNTTPKIADNEALIFGGSASPMSKTTMTRPIGKRPRGRKPQPSGLRFRRASKRATNSSRATRFRFPCPAILVAK